MERIEASHPLLSQPPSPPAALPDPAVTANIYCAGRLDELLLRGIADFWQRVRAADSEQACRIWFVRYRRGGEHLKVRVHGPAAMAAFLKGELQAAVERYFATLPPQSAEELAAKRGRSDVPPLDAEDRIAGEHPDRSLLFTNWERSHISLGGSPLLEDDVYVGHLTTFLGAVGARLLQDLKLDASMPVPQVPHGKRQALLVKIVIGALAGLPFSEEQRTEYLVHHRNWLLRFSLVKALDRSEKSRELIDRYRRQIEKMGEAGTGPISRALAKFWDEANPADLAADSAAIGDPLRELADHLEGFRGDPAYQLDPFSPEPSFTGVFKALHSVANQIGLPMPEEAFTYQLLLELRAPHKGATAVPLLPD